MLISVYVPHHAAIEVITPAYRLFNTANDILIASGKRPKFKVEYVGLQKASKPMMVNTAFVLIGI